MAKFALRTFWYECSPGEEHKLRRGGEKGVRHDVARGPSWKTLVISGAAFQCLSLLSGKRLVPIQRAILEESLDHHIHNFSFDDFDCGPWSQSDIFGAILGLAGFLLQHDGDWKFVRIPESQKSSTPDVLAMSKQGERYCLEFKGMAPQSMVERSYARAGNPRVLDICDRVNSERIKGWAQSKNHQSFGANGRFVSVTVMPDAGMAYYNKVKYIYWKPTTKSACPKVKGNNLKCNERCVVKTSGKSDVAGLLSFQWSVRENSGCDDLTEQCLLRVLSSVHFLDMAKWGQARDMLGKGLLDFIERLGAGLESIDYSILIEFLNQVVTGYIGFLNSVEIRDVEDEIKNAFGRVPRELSQLLSSQGNKDFKSEDIGDQVSRATLEGSEFSGFIVDEEFRLIPSQKFVDIMFGVPDGNVSTPWTNGQIFAELRDTILSWGNSNDPYFSTVNEYRKGELFSAGDFENIKIGVKEDENQNIGIGVGVSSSNTVHIQSKKDGLSTHYAVGLVDGRIFFVKKKYDSRRLLETEDMLLRY